MNQNRRIRTSAGRRNARGRLRVGMISAFLVLPLALSAAAKKVSPIVSIGADGRLVYSPDENGDRVPDFSRCGYAGGDQVIPDVPVRIVVTPKSGDSTARIQKAIDYVASLPADTNGIRGAVLLLKGRHEIAGSLLLNRSGVVLRGQGMNDDGTIVVASGLGRRPLIRIAGKNDLSSRTNAAWQIQNDRVPVGATEFRLSDAGGLHPGDSILVIRPSTQGWIDQLGMTEFGGGIGDWRLTWKPGSRDLVWDRTIQSIQGNLVTIDAPITTALENSLEKTKDESRGSFAGKMETPYVVTYKWASRIDHLGIENLRLESTFDGTNPKDENHSWMGITMENAQNVWVRQITFEHFAGSAVAIYETCKGVTVQDCISLAPVSEDGGYRRNTFFTMGQLTLFLRCYAEHGRHDFAVGHCAAGPNAFVQSEASLPSDDSGPIESWSSGVLYDNVRIDGNGLSLGNRGSRGAGAGWAAANSVLWQCSATLVQCEKPPTAQNWAFGCWGEFEGNGAWRNANEFVKPASLYAAQLMDRCGRDAVARLQLMPRSTDESSNPTAEEASALSTASRKPAPQLKDYIAGAPARDPISIDPGSADAIDNIQGVANQHDRSLTGSPRRLALTNGWLVCDGALLVGRSVGVNWWRGNIRPNDAGHFGLGLTRFTPGRTGSGLTDDLEAVADSMTAAGQVALDYHYGLWYDRRREDHERVRRMNGDVWPPFYEQPFARSGQDQAWDGLSRYDLTKFNPWYWSRLKEFADICDRRGLVLFNENYFQHNIIEAGAHWVDCPWRSANNINNTGFPEPPPFAGDKRIFMAEQFYDVTNAVRRELHRRYIEQCLNNFTNNSNVIQFTSAEFTGPLNFTQFWLDTISDWEREGHPKPLVGLSCTKDVQDAILADPARSGLVDVICFRYWWTTDKGIFAPKGGLSLAPRQFERQWKGGAPSDANLAAMAADYRQRFPEKAILASGEDADLSHGGWAYVCAGGSMPNLPRTTASDLLRAIPKMKPWTEASTRGRWVLREPNRQLLIYLAPGAPTRIDLSPETGTFTVQVVDVKTGKPSAPGRDVLAGKTVELQPDVSSGGSVLWLIHK